MIYNFRNTGKHKWFLQKFNLIFSKYFKEYKAHEQISNNNVIILVFDNDLKIYYVSFRKMDNCSPVSNLF